MFPSPEARKRHQLTRLAQARVLPATNEPQGEEQGTGPPTPADCDLLVEGNLELNFTAGIHLHLKAIQLVVHLSTLNVFSLLLYLSDELRAYVR